MFNQIIFLIIILLLISFSPQYSDNPWIPSSSFAFLCGTGIYLFTLFLILFQNKWFTQSHRSSRSLLLGSANLLLITFFIIYHYILTAQRIFPNSAFLVSAFSLILYYSAIYIFHITAYPHTATGNRGLVNSAGHYASNQVRLLLPFCLPFLFFSLIIDGAVLFPSSPLKDWILIHHDSPIGVVAILILLAFFLILTLLFYPPLTIKIWKCRDLPSSNLKQHLEDLCTKAGFRHAGIKTWTILNHSYTAAIVGILPQFRFVMFTKRLLDGLSKRSIVAILAHEIGHSARKHLLIYPCILIGMTVFTGIFSSLCGPIIDEWFVLQEKLYPSPIWKAVYPFTLFLLYALIFLFYFRFVFGYFSRLFERQADLHVYELGLPVEDMQHALDELGHITGGTHQIPCWHHYSLQKRIGFLQNTKSHSHLINNHHRRVRRNVIGYFFILALGLTVVLTSIN